PTLSAILDACSKPGATTSGSSAFEIATPDHPVTLPMTGEPIATDTPIEQGATLQILNWAVYMYKYVINQFVKQYADNGIKFSGIATFNNMDEGVQKLQSGKIKADVYASYRDVMAIVLMKNGITDLNTGNDADLEKVRTDLLAMIDAVDPRIAYDASYNKLQNDKFSVTTAWSGDVLAGWEYAAPYTETAYKGFGYWFPADRKGPIDNDLIAIPKNAEHPRLAHEFINFWLTFRHAMDNFSWNGYQPPQTKADVNAL